MADLSIPSEKDAKKMRVVRDEERQRKQADAAYEKSRVYPDTPPSPPPVNKKKGGSIRGHGCETKGKTKGRFV